MNAELKNRIKKIKLLVLDVDGILTNGDIIYDDRGKETKIFNVQDGFGIVLFQKAGYQTAILSARSTNAVTVRAKDLKISKVYQDAYPKIKMYQQLLCDFKMKDENVCFMGDDLPDIEVLGRVGFSVTVPDGSSEVKKRVDYVTTRQGGCGAVREVIEIILKVQGQWPKIMKEFKA